MGPKKEFLVRKGGYYYRPNAQGYTSSPLEAGRYTKEEAWAHSHPNGPDGPRDGMSFVHESTVTMTTFTPCKRTLEMAAIKAEYWDNGVDDTPRNSTRNKTARIIAQAIRKLGEQHD